MQVDKNSEAKLKLMLNIEVYRQYREGASDSLISNELRR